MSTVLRRVRILQVTEPALTDRPVDVRLDGERVVEVADRLGTTSADEVLDAAGRWLAPGLWDGHVHLTQWASTRARLDLRDATSAADAVQRVAAHLASRPAARGSAPEGVLVGWGHRSATWSPQPTVAELDAVAGARPVVLVSGDGHHGWLSSAALDLVGVPRRAGVLAEAAWFPVFGRLAALPGASERAEAAVPEAVAEALRLGVVGVVDLEFSGNLERWPARVAAGVDRLRVRIGSYAEELPLALATGLRSGMPLPGTRGLVTMGPLKIISDGSLNTRTAFCCEPYADAAELESPCGTRNLGTDEMTALMAQAHAHGLESAIHAIGDAAVDDALDAFAATGAQGSIEHAQLVCWEALPRLAALGVRASVQPAHLLDDRDVTARCWPDRSHRCFAFRSMLDAGVRLVLGSDAPVSLLDPWLAMAAAVWRSADDRDAWHAEQSLTPREAFAASTDGQGTVGEGSPADLVLLDDDPFASGSPREQADRLRGMRVAATVVGGRVVHAAL